MTRKTSLADVEQEIADLSETLQWLRTVLSFAVRITDKDIRVVKDNLTTVRPSNRQPLLFVRRVTHPSIGQRPTTDETAYSKAIEILGSSVGNLEDIVARSFWEHLKGATDDYRQKRQVQIATVSAATTKLEQTLDALKTQTERLTSGESTRPSEMASSSQAPMPTLSPEDESIRQVSEHFTLARSLYSNWNFPGAAAVATRGIETCNEHNISAMEGYVVRGFARLGGRECMLARRDFRSALELGARTAHVYFGKGACNLCLWYYRQAVKDFTQAIDLEPLSRLYYYGRSLASKGLADAANESNQAELARLDFGIANAGMGGNVEVEAGPEVQVLNDVVVNIRASWSVDLGPWDECSCVSLSEGVGPDTHKYTHGLYCPRCGRRVWKCDWPW